MANAKRDENNVTTLIATSSVDGITPVTLYADPITHRLLVDSAAGSGTVTSVSVVTANGFAGSVATATTTPVITLSTTITGILKGDGTAISAATAGTDYVTASSTNTFTNKTYDTAGTGNVFAINGTSITSVTGTGSVVLSTSPTFTTSILTPLVKATGAGGVEIQNNSGTQVALFGAGSSNGVSLLGTTNIGSASADYFQMAGGTGTITDTATGSSTNININLVPKGTGRLQAGGVTVPTISSSDALTGKTYNGLTITTTTGTLTVTNGKTISVSNSLTLAGTDSTTMTFPSTTATVARTDAAQTFTGTQTFSQVITTANAITASGNAATVPVTSRHNIVTNNSAATLTITLTTTSAVNMQTVVVQILDFSAVAQTITWVNTENSTVTAPTTSNGSTTLPLTVGFMYNSATSKWRCVASA